MFTPSSSPGARLRLVCLPYAGGRSTAFHGWREALGPEVDVRVAVLPGRETRLREPSIERVHQLVPLLSDGLRDEIEPPFALFGHSLGALVAYELTQHQLATGRPLPERLLVSARRPPQLPQHETRLRFLDDERFADEVHRLFGSIPDEVRRDQELLTLLLPALRADFGMLETYVYWPEPPLSLPIHAFGGTEDPWATPAELRSWSALTTGPFDVEIVPGGHLFLLGAPPGLLSLVRERLGRPRGATA